jgi:hypothetical protein
MVPRMLCVVEESPTGMLGGNSSAPLVQSLRTTQEKQPWKGLPALRGNIEKEFLYPLYLGASIAPYRILTSNLAVIPWNANNSILMDSESAQNQGYAHLSKWFGNAERMCQDNGQSGITFQGQIDYFGKLTAQFPIPPIIVAYSASGTLPAAVLLQGLTGIIEHSLYWIKVETNDEGYYLLSILNSETSRKLAEGLQARGQWGARHFDKVILSLPIPQFDSANQFHLKLVKAAQYAEQLANRVRISEEHLITARHKIRTALKADGVGDEIDKLVEELLKP